MTLGLRRLTKRSQTVGIGTYQAYHYESASVGPNLNLPLKVPVKTYVPKPAEIERQWFIVDADGLTLGRMATEVASVLRGKHKPTFAQHTDTGDHVIVVNAEKVVLTANKAEKKMVHDHSGYPGGLRSRTYAAEMASQPAEAVRRSIGGMLPKTKLGNQQLTKLKVYAGAEHPHGAQNPTPLEIAGARRES